MTFTASCGGIKLGSVPMALAKIFGGGMSDQLMNAVVPRMAKTEVRAMREAFPGLRSLGSSIAGIKSLTLAVMGLTPWPNLESWTFLSLKSAIGAWRVIILAAAQKQPKDLFGMPGIVLSHVLQEFNGLLIKTAGTRGREYEDLDELASKVTEKWQQYARECRQRIGSVPTPPMVATDPETGVTEFVIFPELFGVYESPEDTKRRLMLESYRKK